MINFSNEIEDLKAELKKLKDKEIELEIQIAIKERPELEREIYVILLLIGRLKQIDKNLKIAKSPAKDKSKLAERLKAQIKYHTEMLISLRESLNDLEEDQALKNSVEQIELKSNLMKKLEKEVGEDEVSLKRLIPSLNDYLIERED